MKKLLSLESFYKKPTLLFLVFWMLVLIVYAVTWRNGFYMDFLASIENINRLEYWEFINQSDVEVTASFYQVTESLIYIFLKLFGLHPLPWFLLFTAMFAFTGVLIFHFFKFFFEFSGWNVTPLVPLSGVLFLLLAPISAEVVVWKACLQYHPAIMIIFSILIWSLKYIETKKSKYIIAIIILYSISTLMLEVFYLTPTFVFAISLSLLLAGRINSKQFKNVLLKIFIPILIIWCTYLIAYFFVFNKWIAHYNVNISASFEPLQLLGKLNKTMLHIFFFEYLLPNEQRQAVLAFVSQPAFVITSTLLALTFVTWGIIKYKQHSPRFQMILLNFILGVLSCTIIMPLWFNDANMVYNDRYFYLPSIFFFMMGACIFIPPNPPYKFYKFIVPSFYMICLLCVTFKFVLKFRGASKMISALAHNYKYQNADTVILLNLPHNFDGIYMIPAFESDDFYIHYYMQTGDSLKSKIYDVSSYNIKGPYDGAHVVALDSNRFKVTLNQYGTWWWYKAFGASNYENELYKVTIQDNGFSYLLELKQPLSEKSKIIFHANLEWKEVDRKKIGVEQW